MALEKMATLGGFNLLRACQYQLLQVINDNSYIIYKLNAEPPQSTTAFFSKPNSAPTPLIQCKITYLISGELSILKAIA
jgi:hypothetical protein